MIRLGILAMLLILSACGGGSGGTGGNTIATPNRIFFYDGWDSAIASSSRARVNTGPDTLILDTNIVGFNPGFGPVDDLALDVANDRIYVSNNASVLVFDNASTATGDISPTRTITSTSFNSARHLYLDTVNDELYIADSSSGIWVINNASTATGSIVPDRSIYIDTGGISNANDGIALDITKNILYVSISEKIYALNNASTVSGNALTADRIITSDYSGSSRGQIVVDESNDRLFMAGSSPGSVQVFDSVSTLDGTVSPNRTITFAGGITDIKMDFGKDRLYAVNPDLLYVVTNVSTADGFETATKFNPDESTTFFNAIAIVPE